MVTVRWKPPLYHRETSYIETTVWGPLLSASPPLVKDTTYSGSSTWGDYDNDGDPDLFVANQHDADNFLYRNADYLAAILEMLKKRNYHFISLEQALKDPAYETPDKYSDRWGISWLHRWRYSLGLENRLRDEPDLPDWIYKTYRELKKSNDSGLN